MPIRHVIINSRDASINDCQLDINVSSDAIIVSGGEFVIASQSYLMDDDVMYEPEQDMVFDKHVVGYLIRDSEDVVDLLVDEILLDGEDLPYNFSQDSLLMKIFDFRLPSGDPVDLVNDVDIRVFQIIPKQDEAEHEIL